MQVHLDGKLTSLARGAVIVLTVQMSGAGLSYLVQVLLARWMGLAEYGTYDYVMAWGTFLAILAGFGFPTSVLRFLPQYTVNQDWARLRGLVFTSWPLTLSAGFVLSLLGTVVLFLNPDRSFANSTPLLLGLWMVPLFALLRLQSEMSRAIGQVALAYLPNRLSGPFSS